MSKIALKTEWKGNMKFESDVYGHKVVVDADASVGARTAAHDQNH